MIPLVNIFLMLISAVLALLLPYQLVLISYAVLGPLHYLTEIAWLHERNYFTGKSLDYLSLTTLTIAALYLPPSVLSSTWILAAFAVALVLCFKLAVSWRSVLLAIIMIAVVAIAPLFSVTSTLALLLVTVVHIYIFTGMFILAGALKRNSFVDYLSLLVFIACAILTLYWPSAAQLKLSHYVAQSSRYFQIAASTLGKLLGLNHPSQLTRLMAFLSFAYTYHYLNWFSKTSIIGWHKINKFVLAIIVTIYLSSIAIYAYDFRLGYQVLLFLSLLHVVLEFPLNYKTGWTILSDLKMRIFSRG